MKKINKERKYVNNTNIKSNNCIKVKNKYLLLLIIIIKLISK